MQPFIIWTQRRTGGTTLTSLLVACSGLPAWQDEPFNYDRALGDVSSAYDATRDEAALAARMPAVLAEQRVLKHCVETVPWPVSLALLRASRAHGYRHVLLLRRNETERMLSLVLAEMTGAWGPDEARERYRGLIEGRDSLPPVDLAALEAGVYRDTFCLGRLVRALLTERAGHATVLYEDLFSGEEAERRRHFDDLARHLGLPPRAADDEMICRALMGRSQETRSIHRYLPNLAEAVALIERLL